VRRGWTSLALDRGEEVAQTGTVAGQIREVTSSLEVSMQDVAGHPVCLWTEQAADVVVDEVQDLIGYPTSCVGVLQEQPRTESVEGLAEVLAFCGGVVQVVGTVHRTILTAAAPTGRTWWR
jgi:hypothetical protein